MNTFLRFPGFKRKALTFSYDDGTVFDKRLVEIFNKNGMKGTFNLNSGSYGNGRRLTLEDALTLFKGSEHEVAVHGVRHLSLAEVPTPLAMADVLLDRLDHEEKYGYTVRGMAYANGSYDDKVVRILADAGIVYSRTANATHSFNLPTDWLRLHPTCHHKDPELTRLAEEFLDTTPKKYHWQNKPQLFYVWGHSYEFNDADNWELIEEFCEKLSGKDYIWYATNIEIYDYVKAFESLIWSADGKRITNPTATDVYTCILGQEVLVPRGESIVLL